MGGWDFMIFFFPTCTFRFQRYISFMVYQRRDPGIKHYWLINFHFFPSILFLLSKIYTHWRSLFHSQITIKSSIASNWLTQIIRVKDFYYQIQPTHNHFHILKLHPMYDMILIFVRFKQSQFATVIHKFLHALFHFSILYFTTWMQHIATLPDIFLTFPMKLSFNFHNFPYSFRFFQFNIISFSAQ